MSLDCFAQVRMRERESVLAAILQLGKKLAAQKSFLKLRKPDPESSEGTFVEYTRKMSAGRIARGLQVSEKSKYFRESASRAQAGA